MLYLFEHLRFEPNYEDYLAKQASIGDAGQYLSEGPDTPLHQLFVYWMGDDTPCNAETERFLWVTEIVQPYGGLPLVRPLFNCVSPTYIK
jgi:hypothetical protein